MKYLETLYVFDASAQTVQFTRWPSGTLKKEGILLISNVEDGVIIYNFADPAKGGTIASDAGGDILTLEHDTTSMSDTDALQIFYDDGSLPSSDDLLSDVDTDLQNILSVLPPSRGAQTGADSLSIVIASSHNVPVVNGGSSLSVDDGGGSLTVDGTVTINAIPAGTNNIGDVDIASIAAGDNNIGNVDVVTLPSIPAGNNNIGDVDVASLPALVAGTAIIGRVGIDQTTPGTTNAVQANAGTNLNTSALALESGGNLAAIKTAVETIDNFISGTKGLVTEDNSAAIKTAVETIDNFISGSRGLVTEDNSAAIKTSVELLDDAVIADNAQFTDGTTKLHMKGFIYDEVAGTALTENDAAAARINANRAQVGALEDGATRGRYATVTAANALKVDASGVAVPVTDNSGSLTVDAPVGTPVFATLTPSTTGGWDTFMASSSDGSTALTNSAQAIKGSAGTFGGYYIYNPNSSAVYVHIYDVASGSVTVGTTNPKNTFCIPATSGANLEITNGIKYSTAMSCAATTTGGGNTAPSTALEANFFYK